MEVWSCKKSNLYKLRTYNQLFSSSVKPRHVYPPIVFLKCIISLANVAAVKERQINLKAEPDLFALNGRLKRELQYHNSNTLKFFTALLFEVPWLESSAVLDLRKLKEKKCKTFCLIKYLKRVFVLEEMIPILNKLNLCVIAALCLVSTKKNK